MSIIDLLKKYCPRFGPNDPILATIINRHNNIYKNSFEENMYEIIEKEQIEKDGLQIDPSCNIVICSRDGENVIRRNLDGTLNIVSPTDINLSGTRLLINSFSVVNFAPFIKVCCPRGIKLNMEPPFDTSYVNTIYPKFDVISVGEEKLAPSYLRYENFRFTMYVDLDQIKRDLKVLMIKSGIGVVTFSFTPVYYIGCHTFPNIDKVYWIKSTEIFNNIDQIF